jgi:hypothetical protein
MDIEKEVHAAAETLALSIIVGSVLGRLAADRTLLADTSMPPKTDFHDE